MVPALRRCGDPQHAGAAVELVEVDRRHGGTARVRHQDAGSDLVEVVDGGPDVRPVGRDDRGDPPGEVSVRDAGRHGSAGGGGHIAGGPDRAATAYRRVSLDRVYCRMRPASISGRGPGRAGGRSHDLEGADRLVALATDFP
jgi:hypothetical protein